MGGGSTAARAGASGEIRATSAAMIPITSADNPRFRALVTLQQSARDRHKAGRTVLDGIHLIASYREHCGLPEQVIVSTSGRQDAEIAALLAALSPLEPLEFADGLFRKASSVDTPTGVLAVIRTPGSRMPPATPGPCVLLEHIQDPGNLGSILRSTAAAGIREVYLSRRCADAWSPRVLRAGMGAHFLLEICAGVDLGQFAQAYPGRLIATHHHAQQSVFATDLAGTVGLVFGNEGAGLSREILAAVGTVVAIPMPGKTESLNIAAAAAICLFERVRQLAGQGPAANGIAADRIAG